MLQLRGILQVNFVPGPSLLMGVGTRILFPRYFHMRLEGESRYAAKRKSPPPHLTGRFCLCARKLVAFQGKGLGLGARV